MVSTQSTQYRNSRTEVETLLRQRMRGLRSVSFQLPCEEDVLQSAFEKPLCVPQQLAELLQLSVEEVCADFDAMLRHDSNRLGISAEEVREFCVWRNAPLHMLSSQGDLVDSYDPALKEHRTVCFLAFDGHCYMYRAVKRVLERQAARVLYRGEARQTLPPIGEWRRFDGGRAAGPVLARGPARGEAPAYGRWREPQGGHQQPGTRIRELPEEHAGVPGPAAGRAGARDLPEAAQGETRGAQCGGEAEDLGRAGRQVRPVRLWADGRHLRARPRQATECAICAIWYRSLCTIHIASPTCTKHALYSTYSTF